MSTDTAAPTRAQYWQDQIDAWQASSQSQKRFCETHALNYPRFVYWLRKFRRQSTPAVSPGTSFVPVVSLPAKADLTVRLPNGIELRGITEQNVSLVEHLLARL